jgi:hypothetical protein
MSRRYQHITSAMWPTFLIWNPTPKPQFACAYSHNLSQVTCSAFHKHTDKYRLFLKIAQTRLLPNNQSDAQEFDGCITSANQKMSYLMDVPHQPIRGQVIFEYQLANQDWFIYSLYYLIWPVNLGYSYLKHLQPHNCKIDSCRYK